jgi:filamin
VDYSPVSVGDHQVEVKMGDVQVQGSPFVIKAFDVSKVVVSNISNGFVGKPGELYFFAPFHRVLI